MAKEIEITQQDFYDKYNDVLVKFNHYYKYTFTFVGETDDKKYISVELGGNGDDIYREEVNTDEVPIRTLEIYAGTVRDKEGNVIESFYNY